MKIQTNSIQVWYPWTWDSIGPFPKLTSVPFLQLKMSSIMLKQSYGGIAYRQECWWGLGGFSTPQAVSLVQKPRDLKNESYRSNTFGLPVWSWTGWYGLLTELILQIEPRLVIIPSQALKPITSQYFIITWIHSAPALFPHCMTHFNLPCVILALKYLAYDISKMYMLTIAGTRYREVDRK